MFISPSVGQRLRLAVVDDISAYVDLGAGGLREAGRHPPGGATDMLISPFGYRRSAQMRGFATGVGAKADIGSRPRRAREPSKNARYDSRS